MSEKEQDVVAEKTNPERVEKYMAVPEKEFNEIKQYLYDQPIRNVKQVNPLIQSASKALPIKLTITGDNEVTDSELDAGD